MVSWKMCEKSPNGLVETTSMTMGGRVVRACCVFQFSNRCLAMKVGDKQIWISITSWWFQSIWKILVKISPIFGVKIKKNKTTSKINKLVTEIFEEPFCVKSWPFWNWTIMGNSKRLPSSVEQRRNCKASKSFKKTTENIYIYIFKESICIFQKNIHVV